MTQSVYAAREGSGRFARGRYSFARQARRARVLKLGTTVTWRVMRSLRVPHVRTMWPAMKGLGHMYLQLTVGMRPEDALASDSKAKGEGGWGEPASERGDVGGSASEDLVASEAAGGGVNKVEAGFGLGAAVHVKLGEHEVEVRADGVGEFEGRETANVGLSSIQGL